MRHFRGKITLILVAVQIFLVTIVTGQVKNIKGRVTDAISGEPVAGASVMREGTITGTVSRITGEFAISITEGQVLVFSAKGYHDRHVKTGSADNYRVQMNPLPYSDVNTLDTYQMAAENTTVSFQGISAHHFNKGLITTPQELMAGRIAGAQISPKSGAPGDDVDFYLRGRSSLHMNAPLYIVDGIPLDMEGVSGIRNPLSIVNASDIESFVVLKDAAATSIYGSRGANGVIIITSKMAKEGDDLKVNYSALVSVGKPVSSANILTAAEFRSLISDRFPQTGVPLLGNTETVWHDEIYRNAISTDHNLSLSGLQGGVPFRVSYGFTNENGILDTDKFSRVTMSLGVQPSLLDNHLQLRINMKAMLNNNRFANKEALRSAFHFDPTRPVKDDSWYEYFTWTMPGGEPDILAPVNPVALLNMTEDFSRIVSSIGNIQASYQFHNMPKLRAHMNLAYDAVNGAGEIIQHENFPGRVDLVNGGGTFREYKQTRKNNLVDLSMNYTTGNATGSNIFAMTGGLSRQHFSTTGEDRDMNFSETILYLDMDDQSDRNLISMFAHARLDLQDKYFFAASVRQDGLLAVSDSYKWGSYPSVSFAWKLNNEPFLQNSQTIQLLKLRASYGISGVQNLALSFDPYMTGYFSGPFDGPTIFGDRWHWIYRKNLPAEDILRERNHAYNLGLDFATRRSRFSGTVDAYKRTTRGVLAWLPEGLNPGMDGRPASVGTIENKGIEASLKLVAADARNFRWVVGLNGAWNMNNLGEMIIPGNTDFPLISSGWIHPGYPAHVQVHTAGYPAGSFYLKKQVYGSNGLPVEGVYVASPGNQPNPADERYAGKSSLPEYIFGFQTGIQWGSLDLGLSARSHVGQYVYNSSWSVSAPGHDVYHPSQFLTNISRNSLLSGFETPQYLSDFFLSDASFVKLDNITMGYSIYSLVRNVSKVRLFATVQNVYTHTAYKGIDPEARFGIESYTYQRPRNMVFGISIDF
jgi:iron complex outermembrane receptor protein